MRDGDDTLFSLNLAASSSAVGDRLNLAQEHIGAGLVGADAVPPYQASADLDIVEDKFEPAPELS